MESRIDVNISIINDESIEGNETFTIYLTSDVGVNVSPYVQTEVTIIDDEGIFNSNVYTLLQSEAVKILAVHVKR